MQKPNADLFKDTTMTFGEHLEELRSSLVKALLGLMLGVLIGLFIGDDVVELIKNPLEKALGQYYENAAVTQYTAWSVERNRLGLHVPYDPKNVKALVEEQNMLFELRYFHPQTLRDALNPATAATGPPAEASNETPEGPEGALDLAPRPEEVTGAEATDPQAVTESESDAPTTSFTREDLAPVLLWQPSETDTRIRASTLSVQEAFTFWIKASLVVGIILSSPWVFYQIWSFVAAGLYSHEKKYVHIFLPFSIGLFLLGAALAYLFVFEPVLNFLFGFNRDLALDPDPRISEWMSFVLFLPLGFGISFQLPLVMLFMERLGIFTVRTYLLKWRIAILVIFVLSAVLTPADPYSLLLMACPLTVLYFGGVLLCKWLPRSAPAVDES